MRAPRKRQVINPRTGRTCTVYYGSVRHRGKQLWVPGTYQTAKAWERAALARIAECEQAGEESAAAKANAANPTLAEFAGAEVDEETGRVTTTWPRSHPKRRRTKESSIRRAEEGIRPLIRAFGERRADQITAAEAYEFLRDAGTNTRQYAAQCFDDLLRLHPIPGASNPLRGHDLPPRRKRKDRPEFRVLSDNEFDRLVAAAGQVRDDDYGLIQQAAVTAMGTFCGRPGELWALRYERQPRLRGGVEPSWIDFENDLIYITSQITPSAEEVLPKDNEERVVVLPPPMKAAMLAAPRISDFVFCGVRGGRMTGGLWDQHYWPVIRAAFGDTSLEFYELKHRAITWCCTPMVSGGLGLDPATVAQQAGHNDGGLTIAKYYLKLDQELARQRIMEAMAAHAAASAAGKRTLRLVDGSGAERP